MMKCYSPQVQVKVTVAGKAIQEYHHEGNTYVEGREGSNFELEIKNLTNRRILVHPTIDGLSCMTGVEGDRNNSTHGYILGPWDEITVPGWRLNDAEVARFTFCGSGKSYAEKLGKGENKGVIACVVWEEKPAYTYTLNYPETKWSGNVYGVYNTTGCAPKSVQSNPHGMLQDDLSATVYCNTCSEVHSRGVVEETGKCFNLGTGFGKLAEYSVRSVYFNPEDSSTCVAIIYYDNRDGLKKRGIKLGEKSNKNNLPNPFPATKITGCQPPKGWRG